MSRPWIPVVTLALALTACAGSGAAEPATTTTTSPPATTLPVVDDAAIAAASAAAASPTDEAPEWSVSIDLSIEGFDGGPVDTTVAWSGDPEAVVDGGAFGHYGSCSGLRAHVGAYSVFVSDPVPVDSVPVDPVPVESVGIWTADRVSGAGIFDADVRVERAGLAPLVASGTVTILDGLQRGEFLAFGADGGRIEGSFDCAGAEAPTPLRTADVADGELDVVEVFALVRDGDAERVVGLAADATSAAVCPAVTGEAADTVLRVEDGAALGAITAFELDGAPTGTVRLRVAGVDYEFADAAVVLDDTGAAGAFSGASLDGTSVDGAFRCS